MNERDEMIAKCRTWWKEHNAEGGDGRKLMADFALEQIQAERKRIAAELEDLIGRECSDSPDTNIIAEYIYSLEAK